MSLVGFSAVAAVTLLLCVTAGPDRDGLDEFRTGYGSLSAMRNGLAVTGDRISAATVLASVAAMILACANPLAHDVFTTRARPLTPRRERTPARPSAVAVGIPTIALAVLVQHRSLQPLATLPFRLGASALCPALVHGLFWRRRTRAGLLRTLVGGSAVVLALVPGTSLVSGAPVAVFPGAGLNWFPFTTTGLVPIPAGFAFGRLGTVLPGRKQAEERRVRYEALEAGLHAGTARGGS